MTGITVEKIRESMVKGITFDPAIDLRKDMIMGYGYTMEQVLSMSDDEVYGFFDEMEYGEEESSNSMYPVKCECGHHEMECIGYDDSAQIENCYWLKCPKCKADTHIHECSMDSIFESIEYEKQMNDDVRTLNACGEWHYKTSNAKDSFFENELKGFEIIHEIDNGYEVYKFYRKGASFYRITFNPVHSTREVCQFVAKEERMNDLIQHFFKK